MSSSSLQFHVLIAIVAGWFSRGQIAVIDYLQAEIRVLREQQGERPLRFTESQRRLLAVKAQVLGRAALKELGTIVSPETLLRWYRQLIAAKYDGAPRRKPGRPKTQQTIANLVLKMAQDNPSWGYTRIRGALSNLGHEIARNTIKAILQKHGILPAPERRKRPSWSTFLKAHFGAIAGGDFFTVEVLTHYGLVRYFVFFVIDIQSRRVHIAGFSNHLSEKWMKQIARNLTDSTDGFLRLCRYLILDRDPMYTRPFRDLLKSAGVKVLRLPARSPNLNAYAERFVRSIKAECLSKVIPLGERHLRLLVNEYALHYNRERNHQGIGNRLIEEPAANSNAGEGAPAAPDLEIKVRARLGGLLNFYVKKAA